MPAPIFKLSFGGYKPDEIAARLDTLKTEISDWRPGWKRIIPVVNQAISANFANQGAIDKPWTPLKPKYLKQKVKAGYPPDIMVRTSRLRTTATSFSPSLSPGPNQILIAEPTRLGLGVSLEYAYYHDRPQGVRGVQREIFALTSDTFYALIGELTRWTYESAKRAWSGS
jgi:hypothetical protein